MKQLKIITQITNRETVSLNKYLQEISKIQMIDANEEVLLAKSIKQGNKISLERLVKANLRFVVSVAKQYQNQGLTLADLINEGNMGLIKAAHLFDETLGFKFISYAVWWIRQALQKALDEHARIIKLPLNKLIKINKINRAFSYFEHKYKREPNNDELAEILGLNLADIKESTMISLKHVSIDAPIKYDSKDTLCDVLSSVDKNRPDSKLIHDSLRHDINRSLSILSSKEAKVVRLYYGLNEDIPLSLDEIGSSLNITRERVRQIRDNAIKKLKIPHRNKLLKIYL